jgi:hypothetical protein
MAVYSYRRQLLNQFKSYFSPKSGAAACNHRSSVKRGKELGFLHRSVWVGT